MGAGQIHQVENSPSGLAVTPLLRVPFDFCLGPFNRVGQLGIVAGVFIVVKPVLVID